MRLTRFFVGISPLVLIALSVVSCVTQPLVRPIASRDTPETLDYARMAKVVRAVHAVAMEY